MSDSIVVNVLSPEVTNINVNDTGENIYINPLTLNQGIINHSVTHQSGGSDELLHNLLGGLQGGSGSNYYHLTSGEYANLVTGAVIRPSDTGAFYPNSNPSGFITGVNLSGYVTGDVVRPSETGNFITASQTGAFYPRSNPSGFITGVDLSAYVTGDVVRPSETGIFYLASNPSGFITGVDLSAYVTGSVVRPSETGDFINFNSLTGDRGDVTVTGNSPSNLNFSIDNFAITSGKIADSAVTTAKIANFNVTTDKLSSLSVTTNIIATNAVTNTKLADMASQRIKGRISAGTSDPEDLTASQVRTLIDFDHTVSGLLSGYVTGSVVRPSETGAFYAASNPSGFITGVDLSFSGNYYTKSESESRYVNTTGTETILGDKTFHDKVYINSLYVTGLETIVNTTNTNVASNFIMLNLTGGAVDGGLFFVTGAGLTGINDSGAILGFDHSDKFKFGIGTRASDLSVLDTIASVEEMTGISGNLQTQISTLSNATGSYVLNSQTGAFYPTSNPSGFVTGLVVRPSETGSFITTAQTGSFYPISNPSGYVTGSVVRPSETGSFITSSQTGAFYPTSNPSGFATLSDPVRTTVTGNGATSIYAISGAGGLVNPSALIVAIDGALQEPNVDYTVSGGNITFTSALPSGSKAVVVSPVNTIQVGQVVPSDGSVTSAKIAEGVVLTSPSLVGPVNLTSQDASTADRVMNRGLVDARINFFLPSWHEVPASVFSALTLNGGTASTTYGNQIMCNIQTANNINSHAVVNHLGMGLNAYNTGSSGISWQRPFTIAHTFYGIAGNSITKTWMRLGSTSSNHINPPPALPNYVSAGWVVEEVTASTISFRAYKFSQGSLSYGSQVSVSFTQVNSTIPFTFVTTSDGTTMTVYCLDRSGVVLASSQVSVPSETVFSPALTSLGLISDGVNAAGVNYLRLIGSVKWSALSVNF